MVTAYRNRLVRYTGCTCEQPKIEMKRYWLYHTSGERFSATAPNIENAVNQFVMVFGEKPTGIVPL